jgi:hypothetical protein
MQLVSTFNSNLSSEVLIKEIYETVFIENFLLPQSISFTAPLDDHWTMNPAHCTTGARPAQPRLYTGEEQLGSL